MHVKIILYFFFPTNMSMLQSNKNRAPISWNEFLIDAENFLGSGPNLRGVLEILGFDINFRVLYVK